MSVLFATNFSEAALRASEAAARMALRRQTKLHLVYAEPEAPARTFGEPLQRTAERALREEAERLRALGADVEHALLTGPLQDVLMRFAEKAEAELVVVGEPPESTYGRWVGGPLDRLLLGTRLPLLVIKDPAPFIAWAEGRRLLRVMLGVDRSETSALAAEWLVALHRFGPLEVVAAHVAYAFEEARRLGLPPPVSYDALGEPLRRALEGEVRTLATPGPELAPSEVLLTPGLGRAADHLLDLAREAKVDLLVVGAHQRRALGKLWSVSHVALRLAPMSVACVPFSAARLEAEAPVPSLQRALVATDFSSLGNRAVPYAFSLVPPSGTVFLLHVGEAELSDERVEGLERKLRALAPRAALLQGKRVEAEAVPADGADVAVHIAQAAARHGVDVVVLGSLGGGGVRKALLGSVTRSVMGRVHVPVLVVPPHER